MTLSTAEFSQRKRTGSPHDLHAIYERSNLTRLQILYWIAQTLRPSDPFLSTTLTFTIPGPVDHRRLQAVFQKVLARSDAHRTVIHEVDGVPQSSVLPNGEGSDNYRLEFLDLSQEQDPETAYSKWLQKRASTPLDMAVQLYDSVLVKLGPDHFVWYLKQHHIIADASSSFLLFEHVAALYEQASRSAPVDPPQPPPFEEYVAHERAYRESEQYQKSAKYWERKLSSRAEPVRFFGKTSIKETTQVRRATYDLGMERSQRLREMARQKGIFIASEDLSLYNVFATLFFIQLHQMSGNRRLGLLTPVHNRVTPAFKKTIGLLMELCPLQIEVTDEDTFLSLLGKVKRITREAMLHYQYGSGLALDGRSFDIMFNMYQMPPVALDGIPVQPQRIHSGYGTESLVLHVADRGASESFALHFDFHEEVFTAAEQEEAGRAFVRLIDAFLEDNTRSVGSVNYLSTGDSHQPASIEAADIDGPHVRPEQTRTDWYRSLVGRRDPLEFQLTQIWEDVLGVRPIDVKDNFFDLGGNSLLAVRLFAEIEELTGKNLSLSTLLKAGTIEEQARLLREEGWSASWSSLVPLQPQGDRPPFFCVHGGGGNVIHYRMLAHYLGPDQPFYGLQPRGMDGKEPFHTSVKEMAAYYIDALRKVQPEGPYYVGGYCFGATIAFEMAHQLQQQGQRVALLVSLNGATYDYPQLLGSVPERALRHLRTLLRLKPADAFAYLKERLQQRGARTWKRARKRIRKSARAQNLQPTPGRQSRHPPHHRKMVRTLKRANREYNPQVYPGQLTLFRTLGKHDDELGWGKLFKDGVEIHEIAANDSMDIFKEPHVEVLAKELRDCLDNARMALPTMPNSYQESSK